MRIVEYSDRYAAALADSRTRATGRGRAEPSTGFPGRPSRFARDVAGGGDSVGISDFGLAGRHVFLDHKVDLRPGASRRFLPFLLACSTRGEAASAGLPCEAAADDFAPIEA